MRRFPQTIPLLLLMAVLLPSVADAQSPVKGTGKASWVPTRDVTPVVNAINREWSRRLEQAQLAPADRCDDATFLRRSALDLTGRIPALTQLPDHHESSALNRSADWRMQWVDSLLSSRAYAEHLARCWRRLIQPPDLSTTKSSVDRVTPWLADQFAAGRPWNELVHELLTVEVDFTRDPRGTFFAANSDLAEPQPALLAASAGRVFLGVQIGCAECHNHPFAEWTQQDFWGLAAYFGRTRKVSKGDFTLTEASVDGSRWKSASISIPDGSGQASGQFVAAKLLGSDQAPRVSDPLRDQLAAWIVADSNPYFAKAMVNRLWAHCMGRGLVEPLDDQRDGNESLHPQLLQLLADEFIASDYDIRHILRCIVLSRPYQLAGAPASAEMQDAAYFSQHISRAMTPDVLYDSLSIAINPVITAVDSTGSRPSGKPGKPGSAVELEPRDTFIRFFGRGSLDNTGDVFSYGIPQLLRLMNDQNLTGQVSFLPDLLRLQPDPQKRIDILYRIAYSRSATESEQQRMLRLIGQDTESVEGYADVFWALLNSSEFLVID